MAASRPGPKSAAQPMRILSSSHLGSGEWGELSEFEFGLIVAGHAFDRWVVRCMAAAGLPDLAVTDVLVLHHVHHRGRSKKLADICFTLNYEDTHVVTYALRKLANLGLIAGEKIGKEVFWATTAEGAQLVAKYREVRERCLTGSAGESLAAAGEGREAAAAELARLAQLLRTLSGLYDQAARAAASL